MFIRPKLAIVMNIIIGAMSTGVVVITLLTPLSSNVIISKSVYIERARLP